MRIETDSVPGTVTGVSGLIDVHAHFATSAYREAVERSGTAAVDGHAQPVWNAEQALDVMGDLGIEYSVLSPGCPTPAFALAGAAGRAAREFNEELADQIADDPRTFGGVAYLPLPDVDAALEELAYALDVLKLDGVHVVSSYGGRSPGDREFAPLLEELNRRRTTVVTHPTGSSAAPLDLLFETTRLAFGLHHHGILRHYPEIHWILAHGGATILQTSHLLCRPITPPPGEDADPSAPCDHDAADHVPDHVPEHVPEHGPDEDPMRGLHVDVVWNVDEPRLSGLVTLLGPDRLLFGSDLPGEPPARVAQSITTLRDNGTVAAGTKKAIACDNALRLFPSVARKLHRLVP